MDVMAEIGEKKIPLACVDPPYGIGEDKDKTIYGKSGKGKTFRECVQHKEKQWDKAIPKKEYFNELFRVSKNQIIWGGNYFTDFLFPTKSWIFWYKKITNPNNHTHSDGELAWTSFKEITRMVAIDWIGFGYINSGEKKIHTSQKPVALYKWLLSRYAKPTELILDTHGGSGSIVIACHDLGHPIIWVEKDADYYRDAVSRYKTHALQAVLFEPVEIMKEQKLFEEKQ
jgi:site-specific DNA-methyltransferase (adenine-specific)